MFARLHFVPLVAALLIGSAVRAEMPQDPAIIGEPLIEASARTIAAPVVTQSISVLTASAAADEPLSLPAPSAAARPAQPVALRQRPSSSVAASSAGASGGLAALVARFRASSAASRELECLAGAIYFESKSEPLVGQLAVGQVIANRSKSGRFPSSYCGVVFQRGQFSFVRNRSMPVIAKSSLQWRTAVAIAQIVDRAMHASEAARALFFHARRVSPGWRLTRLATIGNHVFYR